MRAIRWLLVLAGLTMPAWAFAAAPSDGLGVPPGCRSPQDQNDVELVIEACSTALKADTATSGERHAWLLFFRAYAYVERGRIEEAQADLLAAIKAAPNIANPYHELAYVLDELGDFDGAEAAVNKAMELEPTNAEHPKERAFARLQKGDYAGAAADYALVLQRGGDPLVRMIDAYALALNGDIAGARGELAHLPAKPANDGDYQSLALKVLAAIDPPDGAADPVGRCSKAFEGGSLDPQTARICTSAIRAASAPVDRANALRARSLAWLYSVNIPDAAKADIEAAVRLNANDDGTVAQRCTVLTATATVKRQVKRAIADCTRAIELCKSANCAFHHASRADAYLTIRDYKAALADAEIVIKARPDLPDGYRIRGEAKLGLGDNDGAKADLLEARRHGGEDDHLKELLGKVGVKMDDVPVATPKPN